MTPPELYIRQVINHKWVTKLREILKEGRELDAILVVKKVEGIERENIIISGDHRFMAYQGLRETIPVLYLDKEISREEFFRIQFFFPKPELQLKEEDLKEYAKKIYREFSNKGYPKTEIYKKIAEIVNRSEKTVRRWLSEFIEKEKEQREELKRRAIELREEGKSIREISEELGVPERTVMRWLKDVFEFVKNCEDKRECLSKLEEELKVKGIRDFRSVAKVIFENFSREDVLKLLKKKTEEISERNYEKGEMDASAEEKVKTY